MIFLIKILKQCIIQNQVITALFYFIKKIHKQLQNCEHKHTLRCEIDKKLYLHLSSLVWQHAD